MSKTIWGHTIVKNEDKYLWFAVTSVIDYLDKILLWDTGSTDNTVEIINLLKEKYPDKIDFREVGQVDAKGLTKLRQEMLDQTKSDWLLLVDGDEVWFKEGIEEMCQIISKENGLEAIITPVINLIGDIYHYQEEAAGQYNILGKKGHFNIRAMNKKIPGLHIKNDYPLEGYYDKDEVLVQSKGPDKLVIQKNPIFHFTYVSRSSEDNNVMKRSKKKRYEIGNKFPQDFCYPEVFLKEYPSMISNPWVRMSQIYKARAYLETPLKKLKRRIFKGKNES